MRLIVDSLIALMLVAILAGVLWHYRDQQRLLNDYKFIHDALDRLHDQTLYHKSLKDVKLNSKGYPADINPTWFGRRLPINIFVPTNHPWMDIAPPHDSATDPSDPVITNSRQAGLWYNPNNGIFRARVNRQLSDEATLQMYNRINGTALAALPQSAGAAPRTSLPFLPGKTGPSAAVLEKMLARQAGAAAKAKAGAQPTRDALADNVSRQPTIPATAPKQRHPRPTLLNRPASR